MKVLVCLAVLLVSAPASAQSLKLPTIVFVGTVALDLHSTYTFLDNLTGFEANPLLTFAENKPLPTVLVGAALSLGSLTIAHKTLGKKHRKLLMVGLYVASGVEIWVASRNYAKHNEIMRRRKAAVLSFSRYMP